MDFETLIQQLLQSHKSQQPWQQQNGWSSRQQQQPQNFGMFMQPQQQQQQPQDLGMFMQYLQPQQQQIAKTDSVEQLKANGVQPKQGGIMSKGG